MYTISRSQKGVSIGDIYPQNNKEKIRWLQPAPRIALSIYSYAYDTVVAITTAAPPMKILCLLSSRFLVPVEFKNITSIS